MLRVHICRGRERKRKTETVFVYTYIHTYIHTYIRIYVCVRMWNTHIERDVCVSVQAFNVYLYTYIYPTYYAYVAQFIHISR